MRKTALITGGARGIGYGVATLLAKQGYDLAINGVRDEAQAREQLDALRKFGVKVIYCQGNIADDDERKKVVSETIAHFNVINLLVNNAGVAPQTRNDILDLDEVSYDRLMDINLKGTFFLTQLVARTMLVAKGMNTTYQGCIITITSMSADVASINRAEYCMSKSALSMMTKLFAVRLGQENIPVYEVRPGIIRTDMTSGVKEKYDSLIADGLTIEKRWGTPEDIGKIVWALANGDIPYATGQIITADGGLTLSRL
jgi:NAD(P)-dependent dehydrogenase (short-subunit alcohol dehydrogenase family)